MKIFRNASSIPNIEFLYKIYNLCIIYILGKIQSSSLIDLSDSQTLYMLIESIYKEIAATTVVNPSTENDKNRAISEFYQEKDENQTECNLIQKQANIELKKHENNSESFLRAKNLFGVHHSLLEELKTRKVSTNNWNQKITIELVECKIKLKQLIMEM